MPLYEYKCINGHHFEEIQKFADAAIEHCPQCNEKAERLISPGNFSLKGDGWYRDGYTKKSKPNDTDAKEVARKTREALIKQDTGG